MDDWRGLSQRRQLNTVDWSLKVIHHFQCHELTLSYSKCICCTSHIIPIRAATHKRNQADIYGMQNVKTTDCFAPSPFWTTSASLAMVIVAAWICVTVTVTGSVWTVVELLRDPVPPILWWLEVGPIIEDSLIWMHPFGEHIKAFGQHPPPVASEHLRVSGRHCGGWRVDSLHCAADADELQQKTLEEVIKLGWHVIWTGQHIFWKQVKHKCWKTWRS